MPAQHLFEYAVVRLVPRVERGEYLNIGVILYCKKPAFLHTLLCVDETRIRAVYPKVELADIQTHLQAFDRVCRGAAEGGPIALLDMPSRFRWLTAKRSTMLQCSEIHPGFCTDPAEKLQQLLDEMVVC